MCECVCDNVCVVRVLVVYVCGVVFRISLVPSLKTLTIAPNMAWLLASSTGGIAVFPKRMSHIALRAESVTYWLILLIVVVLSLLPVLCVWMSVLMCCVSVLSWVWGIVLLLVVIYLLLIMLWLSPLIPSFICILLLLGLWVEVTGRFHLVIIASVVVSFLIDFGLASLHFYFCYFLLELRCDLLYSIGYQVRMSTPIGEKILLCDFCQFLTFVQRGGTAHGYLRFNGGQQASVEGG